MTPKTGLTPFFFAWTIAAGFAAAQDVQLPTAMPSAAAVGDPWSPGPIRLPPIEDGARPASWLTPGEYSDTVVTDTEVYIPSDAPKSGKEGLLQRVALIETWIPRGDSADVGFLTTELSASFAIPAPTPESPLIFTPGIAYHLVDGPDSPDLPSQLYDGTLEIRWMSLVAPLWGVDLAVTPGWHSDFNNASGDAFRVTAHALASYEWSPTTKLVVGVLYLDQDDLSVVPAGGIIWAPNDDTRLELVVPRPRFARRFQANCDFEDWWYLAGEFGSGQWAIERASGADDVITLRDYRLMAGLERKSLIGGLGGRLEVGYVFGRSIEYQSGTPEIEPDPTVMLRAAIVY